MSTAWHHNNTKNNQMQPLPICFKYGLGKDSCKNQRGNGYYCKNVLISQFLKKEKSKIFEI